MLTNKWIDGCLDFIPNVFQILRIVFKFTNITKIIIFLIIFKNFEAITRWIGCAPANYDISVQKFSIFAHKYSFWRTSSAFLDAIEIIVADIWWWYRFPYPALAANISEIKNNVKTQNLLKSILFAFILFNR